MNDLSVEQKALRDLYWKIFGRPVLYQRQQLGKLREAYTVGIRLASGCPVTRAGFRSGVQAAKARGCL